MLHTVEVASLRTGRENRFLMELSKAMKVTCISLLGLLVGAALNESRAEGVRLREQFQPGQVLDTVIELEAQGAFLAGDAREGESDPSPDVRVRTRFDFADRVLSVDSEGAPLRLGRWVREASLNLQGEEPIPPLKTTIHPEVRLLVVEAGERRAITFSPRGPLSRADLELVQGPTDPLDLAGLLPVGEVGLGDSWKVNDRAARSLSSYDALATNALEATLEALDEASAHVRIAGRIGGAVLGGTGTITCEGTLHFDRSAGRIVSLKLQRQEAREPGPVEAGLEFQSTLRLTRRPSAEPAPELAAGELDDLPDRLPEDWRLLTYTAPDGRFSMLHDRDWHLFNEDDRQTVLRWVHQGEIVAQANLIAAPKVEPGRHQDVTQFRDDLRQALGSRFGRFLEAGEVEGAPAGGFRYRVVAAGRQGEEPIFWYYYLVAGPDGDQLVAAFTLRESRVDSFGDQDRRMIGSLEWASALSNP
ncbi:hypothetical protein BH23PLA1_BH23PLA1_34320 [soil metagenome]